MTLMLMNNAFNKILICCLWGMSTGWLFAEAPLKVLFVGNSQTYTYNLPLMIKILSESAPAGCPRIDFGRRTVGGKALQNHWDKGEIPGSARAQIATGAWDYVVIQEIYRADEQTFRDYAARFDDAIRKAGSKTILLATAGASEYYPGPGVKAVCYPDDFKKLNDMQIALGKERGIPVAAAGYAWMKYLGPNPSEAQRLDLYDTDKGHPGPKGTYLYACLLYAVLTGKTPEGLTNEFKHIRSGIVIPKAEAANMQRVAWEVYQETTIPKGKGK